MASPAAPPHSEQAPRWLSEGLEALLDECLQQRSEDEVCSGAAATDFDLIIVGSGYGGALAAQQLAGSADAQGRPLRIALLERGREYLAGAFPGRFAELPAHLRWSTPAGQVQGYREGLFDFRLGPDMCVALANGLGGGSLINAGVMEAARPEVLRSAAWPAALRSDPDQMQAWYAQAGRLLGSVDAEGRPNTIERLDGYAPARSQLMQDLAPGQARTVAITVALDAAPRSSAGLDLQRCVACGDCATGCNHGAKQSLDSNALLAARRQGVRLITGASVLQLQPRPGGGWLLALQASDAQLRAREPGPLHLSASRVVLAAGSLGSTEILLRSRAAGLALSDRLGRQFSGNGDVLAAAVDNPRELNALADEDQAPAARQAGPTITAMIDARDAADTGAAGRFVVQDLAIPGPLRWAFEESFALADTLDGLARSDDSAHGEVDGRPAADPYAISPARSRRLLPLALMGLDAAQGELCGPPADAEAGIEAGQLHVRWPGARDDPAVQARHDWLARRLQARGARLLANPLWRLLPPAMSALIDAPHGPMLTVHPLGGCAMADDACQGVVNEWGQVFSGRVGTAVHEGLVVLDGAIVPAALGINPALTISALALRALATLKRRWGLRTAAVASTEGFARRPVYRRLDAQARPPAPAPTLAELRERVGGLVRLPGAPGGELKYLELTLQFRPVALRTLLLPPGEGGSRRLLLEPAASRLRLFDTAPDPDSPGRPMLVKAGSARGRGKLWMHAERADADARWIAPLAEGELRLFERQASSARQRRCRALHAWFMNRGWRDMIQGLSASLRRERGAPPGPGLWARARSALQLASHAGQRRLMDYRLRLDPATAAPDWAPALGGGLWLHGRKTIGYSRRANPWVQLSELRLETGPWLAPPGQDAPLLRLDLFDLARQRQPLLRISQAADLPSSFRDVAALLAYIGRLMLGTHLWTLRKPDEAPPRRIERLPGPVPGLPLPEIVELAVGRRGDAGATRQTVDRRPRPDDELPVHLRLTRYRASREGARPLLMIHGYSASGTTFAHAAVQPGPAKILWDAGYDIWILDLRTSAGLDSARLPWTFEECALNDIPLAIDHVLRISGAAQLDVLAHCMGAVMLHMALLQRRRQPGEQFHALRQRLMHEGLIRRLVISQVTPLMIYSPTNSLRALLMQHLRPWLPMLADYAFRPEGPKGLMDELIDRLLSSLPYPDAEFDIENPPPPAWRPTPWTATRHRMDLLYGRDFSVRNIAPAVLAAIDDHFGPLHMDTVAQAIHFARCHEITDVRGASVYLDDMAKSLALLQRCKVLSVHGQDNGLCAAESGELTASLYAQVAPGRYRFHVVADHGHQDCLIGRDIARTVFPAVLDFLREPD